MQPIQKFTTVDTIDLHKMRWALTTKAFCHNKLASLCVAKRLVFHLNIPTPKSERTRASLNTDIYRKQKLQEYISCAVLLQFICDHMS